jgi:hypothetical protein
MFAEISLLRATLSLLLLSEKESALLPDKGLFSGYLQGTFKCCICRVNHLGSFNPTAVISIF